MKRDGEVVGGEQVEPEGDRERGIET